MDPDAHKPPLALAIAAWLRLLSTTQAYQGAVMAGASDEELERIRREAHDLLDANLDQNGHAASAVRTGILGHDRR